MDGYPEILGWVGALMVLGAYALLSMKKFQSDSYLYHGINIVGSAFLAFYAYTKGAGANVLVNVVWLLIGAAAIAAAWRAGRSWRQL